jgi:hypothetical protein
MSLPQIADIVVNAAAFAPVRRRPHIAGENGEEQESANSLQIFHRLHRTARKQTIETTAFSFCRKSGISKRN